MSVTNVVVIQQICNVKYFNFMDLVYSSLWAQSISFTLLLNSVAWMHLLRLVKLCGVHQIQARNCYSDCEHQWFSLWHFKRRFKLSSMVLMPKILCCFFSFFLCNKKIIFACCFALPRRVPKETIWHNAWTGVVLSSCSWWGVMCREFCREPCSAQQESEQGVLLPLWSLVLEALYDRRLFCCSTNAGDAHVRKENVILGRRICEVEIHSFNCAADVVFSD